MVNMQASIFRHTSQTCLEHVTSGFWLALTATTGGLSQIRLCAAQKMKWKRLSPILSYLTIRSSWVRTRKEQRTKLFQGWWVSAYSSQKEKDSFSIVLIVCMNGTVSARLVFLVLVVTSGMVPPNRSFPVSLDITQRVKRNTPDFRCLEFSSYPGFSVNLPRRLRKKK